MTKLPEVLTSVAERVTPTRAQHVEIERLLKKVLKKAEEQTKRLGVGHTIAGSFIRDTYMLDKRELDLFILFPENATREELEKGGLAIGRKIIKSLGGRAVVAYAEHPYIRGKIDGFDVDIVPAYSIKDPSKIKSAVDRTPFHNQWLQKHLSRRLVTEVRLLKQFLKGRGLYGSDTKTEGFSGYLCELLIVEHKYFSRLLRAASKWKPGGVFLDPGGLHAKPAEAGKRFGGQPMVVIDPVDPNRNVASVLTPANFMRFVAAAKAFLEKPSECFFFPDRAVDLRKLGKLLRGRETEMMAVEFRNPGVLPDILFPQLRRTAQRLAKVLKDNEFTPMGFDVYSNGKSYVVMELEVWKLPRVRKLVGPPVFSRLHAKQFVEKYKKKGRVWTEQDRHVAEVRREFTRAEDCLRDFVKGRPSALKERGIASYVAESLIKGFRILDREAVFRRAMKDRGLAGFLWEYLNREFY
jgi:tRNA nucleotidyltransferase (CCA-adding enzyme)